MRRTPSSFPKVNFVFARQMWMIYLNVLPLGVAPVTSQMQHDYAFQAFPLLGTRVGIHRPLFCLGHGSSTLCHNPNLVVPAVQPSSV